MRRNRAFTLIELLIAVAIIAILIGMLTAVVGMVRRAGSNVVCQNQLRSIGLCVLSYAGDNRGRTPPYYSWQSGGGYWTWSNYISDRFDLGDQVTADGREVAVWKAFHCPEQRNIDRKLLNQSGDIWTMGQFAWRDHVSYGINNQAFGIEIEKYLIWANWDYNSPGVPAYDAFLVRQQSGVRLANIGRPAETMFCIDSERPSQNNRWRVQGTDEIGFRHSTKANLLLADGHVEAMNFNRLDRRWCSETNSASGRQKDPSACSLGSSTCGIHGTPWNFYLQ
jgi:prepilin-type N-terminal cleavage/methylation domain-containing protein/prepilin-type processing-associated H-X9-DG protein